MAAEQSRTEGLVEHEVRVAASPDSVFEYFTDPAKMVMWMGVEATLDPRPGGVCRPRRVVFTWGWETALFKTPPQSTLVEVSLTPDGEDTVVRLAHRRLKPEAVALHRAGWHHYLPRLALAASGADPGDDPWRLLDIQALRADGLLP